MPTIHKEVVDHMMENDFFSQWLGIEVLEIKEGYSKIKMTVRKEMVNGFGIVHGGIPFSLVIVHLPLLVTIEIIYLLHWTPRSILLNRSYRGYTNCRSDRNS
jgi:hypothetical protein